MSILRTIHELGLASNGLRAIHETGKYAASNLPKSTMAIADVEHSFTGATTAIVGQPVMFSGSAPYGYVTIFSGSKAEKTVAVTGGRYYASLFFSKPGTYEMYSVWLEQYKSNIIYVEVTPKTSCENCPS